MTISPLRLDCSHAVLMKPLKRFLSLWLKEIILSRFKAHQHFRKSNPMSIRYCPLYLLELIIILSLHRLSTLWTRKSNISSQDGSNLIFLCAKTPAKKWLLVYYQITKSESSNTQTAQKYSSCIETSSDQNGSENSDLK